MPERLMKDSGIDWICDIPNEWSVNKIKNLVKSRNKKYKLSEVGNYIGLENVESGSGHFVKTESEYVDGYYDGCEQGDLLYGKLRPNLAKVLISPYRSCCTGEFEVIERSDIGKKYLQYYMLTDGFTQIVTGSTYGAKMPRASWGFIENLKIAYPDREKRQAIVDFLDDKCSKIDEISKKIQEEIEILEEYKKSVITEAVTKGLDPNAEMKDSGVEWIGEIPVSWIVLRLKNVCSGFSNGTSITQLTSDISEYPVSRIETISSGAINYDKVGYVAKCNSNYKLNKNDILVSNINSIQYLGNCAMYEGEKPLYHGMNLLRIVPQTINPKYLHYYMKSRCFKTIMQILCKPAINQASVSASNLKNVFIPIPSQKEQNAIVNCLDKKLDSISRLLEAKRTQLSTLEEYKKSLIYEYVTGKREVA